MTCSVVIPCHNRADLTRACLQSLQQQVGGPPTEILLVDNASTDDTPDLATAPNVRLLRQVRNLGFAGGVNRGLAAARSDTILVLNNDTLAAPNLLRELQRALASDHAIAAVSAVSNEVKGQAQLAVGRRGETADGRSRIADELAPAPLLQDATTLAGLCLLLRRRALDEVGVFDERFGHGNFEDDDLCLRLRLAGHRLAIARRAFVHHEGHATFRALGLDVHAEIRRRRQQFDAKWRQDPAGAATIAALDDDVEAAALAARDARSVWPRWADADWHLGRYWALRRDHARAIDHFAALLRHCPEHVDAHLALGASQLHAGLGDRAQATLAHVARQPLTPLQQQYLLEQLGVHAYRNARPADAEATFRSALRLGNDPRGVLRNWLGLCRMAAADLTGACTEFTAAAAAGCAIAHTNLGICAFRSGDVAAARSAFRRASELLPDDPVAQQNYATLCETAGAG
jgi:GT2 family glycosyltransferase/Tfp pilus assembly protein PilF